MIKFTFGSKAFDRNSIPAEIADLSNWPVADYSALTDEFRHLYLAREQAISMFVGDRNMTLKDISLRTQVAAPDIYRLFQRCLSAHPDGRIYGLRALIPHSRVKAYVRTAIVKPNKTAGGRGASGAFSQLLTRYPDIEALLRKEAKRRGTSIDGVQEVRRRVKSIHKAFLQKCRNLGIQPHEYPLNHDLLGMRSMAAYLKKFASESFESATRASGSIKQGGKTWSGVPEKRPALLPYEVVEFDGHKIDMRLVLKVPHPLGWSLEVELSRIWGLVVLDVASRAALGYHLALGPEYNQDDVAEAIQAALAPHVKRKLTIPGLKYQPSGGFPSEVCPQLAYACWDWLRFDNAKAHFAEQTLIRLTEVVGCWPDAGPKGEPNERPFIERFFSLLAAHFAHRIPGTTGCNPEDIRRRLGDVGSDLTLLISVDELEELIDVMISNYNGDPHDGLGGRTPLEVMSQFVSQYEGFLRTLAEPRRSTLCLLQEAREVPVKGNLKNGVRPHINFEGVRYSNEVLSSNPALIGKKLRIYVNVRDVRQVRAFFETGAELGVLAASRPWCFTVHSLRIRKEILRLRRMRKLQYEEGEDPVGKYYHYPTSRLGRGDCLSPDFNTLSLAECRRRGVLFQRHAASIQAYFSNPTDDTLQSWANTLWGSEVTWILVLESELETYFETLENGASALSGALSTNQAVNEINGNISRVEEISLALLDETTSPVVRLVNSTLYDALGAGASDVHIESTASGIVMKYRIDGVLSEAGRISGVEFAEKVLSRIKVMAELDITERRIPQDGRFKVRVRERDVDFRVSVMPSVFGEDAVIRILDKESLSDQLSGLTLNHLGFDDSTIKIIRNLADEPYGMLLVTGPTGSGKTTSLYAALSEVNDGRSKIVTIEDPVEYQLPGVLQIPVNERKGLTFARGLRSILRHDPDKIMVGEIRDAETAQIAVQAIRRAASVALVTHWRILHNTNYATN